MRDLNFYLTAYEKDHLNPTNKIIHYFCVPLIVIMSIGLAWAGTALLLGQWVSAAAMPWVNVGTIALVLSLVFYVRMSLPMFAAMLLFAVASWAAVYGMWLGLGAWGLLIVSAVVWVASWIVQIIGHKFEGAAPSFTNDPVFLLVGPMFLAEKAYRKMGRTFMDLERVTVQQSWF